MVEGSSFLRRPRKDAEARAISPELRSLESLYHRATLLATRNQEPIAPPSLEGGFYDIPEKELKTRFPARYARYKEQVENTIKNRVPKLAEQRKAMQWFYLMNSLDRYAHAKPTTITQDKALKPKQFFVVEKLRDLLESAETQGYMSLPTGFGKTVVLAKLLEAMNVPAKPEASKDMREIARTRALIVVPSLGLISETHKKFAEFAPGLDVGSISSKAKHRLGDHVTVITYASFRNRILNGQLDPAQFDVLVLDEAHEAITDLCADAIDRFRGHAVILGLTATPEYNEEKNLDKLLKNKICEISLNDGVEMGLLCDFTAETYNTNIDVSSVPRSPDGRYSQKEWEKMVNFRQRARVAARLYKERFMGQKLYLFCESITAANITAEVFAEEGIPSASATSETEDDEHDQNWKNFNEGTMLAFASVNQFIRGNDCKRASVAMNLAPTGSKVRAQQRGGRVLRLDPLNPAKHAHIIDFLYTDRRGQPVTFAQIAGREPIDITAGYRSVVNRDDNLDRSENEESAVDIESSDLAETDVGTVFDTQLVDVITIEAQKRSRAESDIFETVVVIERLYEEFVTEPNISLLERTIAHRTEEALDADDPDRWGMHATRLQRLRDIAQELQQMVARAFSIADVSIQVEGSPHTLEQTERGLAAIQLLSFQTQALFEEAAEIAVEYDIDIINLHSETVQAK